MTGGNGCHGWGVKRRHAMTIRQEDNIERSFNYFFFPSLDLLYWPILSNQSTRGLNFGSQLPEIERRKNETNLVSPVRHKVLSGWRDVERGWWKGKRGLTSHTQSTAGWRESDWGRRRSRPGRQADNSGKPKINEKIIQNSEFKRLTVVKDLKYIKVI